MAVQVDVETEEQPVIDRVWVVQENHGPFTSLLPVTPPGPAEKVV